MDLIVSEIVLTAKLRLQSIRCGSALRHQTGAQYSAVDKQSAKADALSVGSLTPLDDPANFEIILFLAFIFAASRQA